MDLLTATETAIAEIRKTGLYVGRLDVQPEIPGARRDPDTQDWTCPRLAEVGLMMFSRPDAFLAWAEHLAPDRVSVQRRDWDTCLHFWVDRIGVTWRVSGSVSRPEGKHLPGIDVDWERQPSGRRGDHAWITVAELRTALTVLGEGATWGTKGGAS
jgi:hypothetical protein